MKRMEDATKSRSGAVLSAISLLLAVAASGCGDGWSTSTTPAQLVNLTRHTQAIPNSCVLSVYIVPRSATIQVNQVQALSAYYHFPFQNLCYTGPIKANWSASGGNLNVSGSGEQASFFATRTGSYTITATAVVDHRPLEGTAVITVVQMTAGLRAVIPLRGGTFSGAYAGTYVRLGGKSTLNGLGKASFLRESTERGGFEVMCGPNCYTAGSFVLTSTRNVENTVTMALSAIYGQGFCDRQFSWKVSSGTGKFAQASGTGSVAFNCSTNNNSYNDSWSGTLTF
jgi:hypothetical protein